MKKLRTLYKSTIKEKGFYWPSYTIHGSQSGLYDLGPLGSGVLDKIVYKLKFDYENYFSTVQIKGNSLAPKKVFEASGHSKFLHDPEGKCPKCLITIRAEEIDKCPKCKNVLEVIDKSLMFETNQGLTLSPETSQSIFTAWKEISRINAKPMISILDESPPISVYSEGSGYRNEISPRNSLIRMIEFDMFEVFFFLNNSDKYVPKYEPLNEVLFIFNNGKKILTSDYNSLSPIDPVQLEQIFFVNDIFVELGISSDLIRFVQHSPTSLSHYSKDTWDAEILLDIGWTEITGIANRGSFDLKSHNKFVGKSIDNIPETCIEVSFGLSRILESVLQLNFTDELGFSFPRIVQPIMYRIGPLVARDEKLTSKAKKIFQLLKKKIPWIKGEYDEKESIGKRYRKADRLGIGLFITIDDKILKDSTLTIRYRSSKKQIRISEFDLVKILEEACIERNKEENNHQDS